MLARVEVSGLFGIFHHEIPFFTAERITILHAPNGYGKTVVLRLIKAFFGGSLTTFREIDFDEFRIVFSDGVEVSVRQVTVDPDAEVSIGSRRYGKSFTIHTILDGEDLTYDAEEASGHAEGRHISPAALERYTSLRRIGSRLYQEPDGRRIHYEDAVDKYWSVLPPSARRGSHIPNWLALLRNRIKCHLVETQRLLIKGAGGSTEASFVPAVATYAANLTSQISGTLTEAATLSQSLDRTFPNRLLSRMRESSFAFTEEVVRERLAALEEKRERLSRVDLTEESGDVSILPEESFDEATLRIFTEYTLDAEKKLSIYDSLLQKLELFDDLINERFTFKRMRISRKNGFAFESPAGGSLPVNSLSSGEQHELVMFYKLIFETEIDTLILIDEPEISLHIAWQKKFLSDLRKIVELSPMDVVVATHSPQLIGADLDLAIELSAPVL